MRLLRRLLELLFPLRADERAVADAPEGALAARIDPELVPLGGLSAVALLPFHHPLARAAIHEAKYRGSERAFALLAAALAEYLTDFDDALSPTVAVVPVPLGAKRRRERGYNQVEEIARRALCGLGARFSLERDLLARTRETASQVSLPRARREENMRDAFAAAAPDPARAYILLDDVVTTGATLAAAAAALKAAGAERIFPIALAH